MKRLLAILLSCLMVLSLVACGTTAPAEDTKPAETEAQGEGETEAEAEGKLDFGGDTITVVMYGSADDQVGTERVFQKVDDYFMEKYNLHVDIQVISFSAYTQSTNMMLSSGEPCDIFCAGWLNFTSTVANESCYDMYENDLIQTYGQDILELVDPAFLSGCTVNGALYGIPCMRDLAVGMWTIVIVKDYLDGINYDYSNIDTEACNPATAEEMTELFAQLHEAYPDVNVIYPWGASLLNQKFVYDPIGGDNFGVLLDPANSLEVSDLFSSDMFMDYCKLMYDWQNKGYISPDAATTTEGGGAQIIAGTLMADTTGGKPGIVRQKEVERGDMDSIAFQLGTNFVRAEQASCAAWAINSDCANPEAAMVVMNALYTDPVVTNLILWGEKDVDYVVLDNGNIDFPEGITKETSEYYNMMPAWALPCEYTTLVRVGDSVDLWAETQEFNDTADKSLAIGFSWDKADWTAEYTALTNIWEEYASSLLYGMVDPEVVIPEMIERLKAAGLDDYIAAKAEAVATWANK